MNNYIKRKIFEETNLAEYLAIREIKNCFDCLYELAKDDNLRYAEIINHLSSSVNRLLDLKSEVKKEVVDIYREHGEYRRLPVWYSNLYEAKKAYDLEFEEIIKELD